MKCVSCPSENVVPSTRACAECIKKSSLACLEAGKKSMEVYWKHMNLLDNLLPDCSTAEERESNRSEYRSAGKSYDHSRLDVLYREHDLGMGGIPRPDKEKSKKRKSMRAAWADSL